MSCPVPEEQQPLNEYLALKQSFFFGWATMARWQYLRVLALIWLAWWIFAGPIAASSYAPQRHLVSFLVLGSLGATLGSLLPLLQLFLGWKYVSDRLQSSKIFYEESGWYDGQTWEKPEVDLAKERLIVSYEVQPLLNKIQWTGLSLILFLILQILWVSLIPTTY
jgi:hypothetical protein